MLRILLAVFGVALHPDQGLAWRCNYNRDFIKLYGTARNIVAGKILGDAKGPLGKEGDRVLTVRISESFKGQLKEGSEIQIYYKSTDPEREEDEHCEYVDHFSVGPLSDQKWVFFDVGVKPDFYVNIAGFGGQVESFKSAAYPEAYRAIKDGKSPEEARKLIKQFKH